mmetsp:Transcript_15204/g.45612  ORF Transcript_15204/g.45612 Transcript_15204/m.45612 type:complete len:258 (-) Transcript_15204:260-1033(-)
MASTLAASSCRMTFISFSKPLTCADGTARLRISWTSALRVLKRAAMSHFSSVSKVVIRVLNSSNSMASMAFARSVISARSSVSTASSCAVSSRRSWEGRSPRAAWTARSRARAASTREASGWPRGSFSSSGLSAGTGAAWCARSSRASCRRFSRPSLSTWKFACRAASTCAASEQRASRSPWSMPTTTSSRSSTSPGAGPPSRCQIGEVARESGSSSSGRLRKASNSSARKNSMLATCRCCFSACLTTRSRVQHWSS